MTTTRRALVAAAVAMAATVPAAGLANAAVSVTQPAAVAARATHPTISLGARGSAVRDLHGILFMNGYGDAAGEVFDRHTRAEVIAFQKDNRLVADGIVGPKTWAALDRVAPQPLFVSIQRVGSRGVQVQILQQALTDSGHRVPKTGYFGSLTRAAVVAFQKQHSLVADGIVGPKTWAALSNYMPMGD